MAEADRRPLTAAQQGVFFAQQLDPDNPSFQCARAIELSGPLDRARLAAAITAVVDEADALHCQFGRDADGSPWRRLVRPARWPVAQVSFASERDPWTAAERWMREDLSQPRPLAGNGLIAEALLDLGPERCIWYQRIHHILIDGIAFAMIVHRVAARYAERDGGRLTSRPFASLDTMLDEELAYLASPEFEADRRFWNERLAEHRGVTGLSELASPPASSSLRAHERLDAESFTRLRALAQTLSTSWATLTIAATAIYLQAMTAGDEVILGLPAMGRLGGVAARVPSTVVNVLPLRLELSGAMTLAELTATIDAELKAIRAHQRYRYERLRADLGLVGGDARLFAAQINVKAFDDEPRFGPGLQARTHHLAAGPVDDIDFIVYGDRDAGELRIDVDANPELHAAAAVRGHAGRFTGLLAQLAAARPLTPIVAFELLDTDERRRVVHDWNATAVPLPSSTIPELIADQAARTPQARAVLGETGTLSYEELLRRADALAGQLRAGTIVAVWLERSPALIVAVLAVLRAGAAYLPLDPDQPPSRLAGMLADAAPATLLCADVPPFAVPPGTEVVRVDAPQAAGGGDAEPRTETNTGTKPSATDPAYVIYTSGSTGAPKGAVIGHRALANRLAWMQHAYPLAGDDRVLHKTPIGFDVSVWELLWPLTAGATVVLAPPSAHRDPRALAELIVAREIDLLHFVPSMLAAFLADPAAATAAGTLRQIICSGEALGGQLVAQAQQVLGPTPVANLYGPTEAAIDVTAWECDPDAPPDQPVPIGRPVWNTRTYVLDGALRPLPAGAIGELYLGGIQLADGYLNRPQLTSERFLPDPFVPGERIYRTGDLACWSDDGVLHYRGRGDEQLKLRGVRIEPAEIEAALTALPQVTQAAVVATTGASGQPRRLLGYVVPDPGAAAPDPLQIRRELAERLPAAMIPDAIVVLAALPLTVNGKLDRRALPEPPSHTAAGGAAPESPLEELLCRLCAETLSVTQIGRDDNLFDLGLSSLPAARLAARLTTATGHDVRLGDIFAATTVAALAAQIEARGDAPDRASDGPASAGLEVLLGLRSRGTRPALFCVHPAGGLSWCYAGLLPALPADRPVWGLQARGLDAVTPLATSIEEAARDYATRIRELQPHGPYHLLGWSVGGVIAHELACQLQQAGAEVGGLVLLDAYPSDQWRSLSPPDEATALTALLYMAGLDESVLAGMPVTRRAVLDELERRGSAMTALGREALSRIVSVVVNNARLMRDHHHSRFAGGALMVVAAAPRPQEWLSASAWAPYVSELEVVDLPCTHPELVHPRRLAEIARMVAPRLRRAERRSTGTQAPAGR